MTDRYRTWVSILLYLVLLLGILGAEAGGVASSRSQTIQPVTRVAVVEYILDPVNPSTLSAVRLEVLPGAIAPVRLAVQFPGHGEHHHACRQAAGAWICSLEDHPSIGQLESIQIITG